MFPFKLKEKENLCREMIELCTKLDPCRVRLQIYIGVSLYELHLPLLQYGKRKWETGQLPTEEFRYGKSFFNFINLLANKIFKD